MLVDILHLPRHLNKKDRIHELLAVKAQMAQLQKEIISHVIG